MSYSDVERAGSARGDSFDVLGSLLWFDFEVKPGLALGLYMGLDCFKDPAIVLAVGPFVITASLEF